MKAMILAAGMGERMRPLTDSRAKPSLPLLNRPMIHHTLAYLSRQGVTEAVINLHHQPDSIRGLVGDGRRYGVRVRYSEEPTILGTAGGLKKAEAFFRGSETLVMINSDFISDCDLRAPLREHTAARSLATLILTPPRPGTEYGAVEVGGDGRILSIAGRPAQAGPGAAAGSYTFTGIHLLEPELIDSIPAFTRVEINRDIYPPLIASGRLLRGHVHRGFWRELGTPRLYLQGTLRLLSERQDLLLPPVSSANGLILEDVKVARDAVIEPPALIARGSSVGARSSLIGGVVIGRQVQVGTDCALRSSILWDGCRVGNHTSLTDCIVTSGASVPGGVSLTAKIILRVEGYQGSKDRFERVGTCWMYGF